MTFLMNVLIMRVLIIVVTFYKYYLWYTCLQCFDAVGWVAGSASSL